MPAPVSLHRLSVPTGYLVLRPAEGYQSQFRNASPTLPDYPTINVPRRKSHVEILQNLQKQKALPNSSSTAGQQRLRLAVERRESKARSRQLRNRRRVSSSSDGKAGQKLSAPRKAESMSQDQGQDVRDNNTEVDGDIAHSTADVHVALEPGTGIPTRMSTDDIGRHGSATTTHSPSCPLTPVEMDLGALAMIASLPDPISAKWIRPKRSIERTIPMTPHAKMRLKSGSIMSIITPEQSCWRRAAYLPGQIKLSHEFLLPTMMMTDMDALAHFIGAATSMPVVDSMIQSDDVVLDGIVDYFSAFGLADVKPFAARNTADASSRTPLTAVAETIEGKRRSERWSGSTGCSDARETIISADEMIGRDDLKRPATLSLPDKSDGGDGITSSPPSPTRHSDRSSTLPGTWVSKHSLGGPAAFLPSPRHPGPGQSSEDKSGRGRKSGPARRNPGRISIRRFLASASSIV